MRNVIILFKTQLVNLFSSNKELPYKGSPFFRYLGVISIFALLCIYNTVSLKSMIDMGLYRYEIAYAVSLSFFFVILMSLFKSSSMFFYNRDFEMLIALPVKKHEILISKFLLLYTLNMVIVSSIFLPAVTLLFLQSKFSLFDLILFSFMGILVPIVPMCLASIVGVLIELVSSCFKKKNIITVMFVTMLFIGYFLFISNNRNSSIEIKNVIERQLFRVFPLAKLFYLDGSMALNVTIFFLVTLAFLTFFLVILGVNYEKIHFFLNHKLQEYNESEIEYKANTQFFALYKKEIKRFLSSNVYIINSSFSTILLIFFSVASLLFGISMLEKMMSINNMDTIVSKYGAFIISAFLVMSCTTSSSMSLEGKNLWILQSSPVGIKKIINSKIAVNLSIHFVAYLLSIVMIITRSNISTIPLIFLIVTPIVYSTFISITGMYLNMKYLNLQWNDEISVVKHSTSAILTNIIGIFSVATPLITILFFNVPHEIVVGIMVILLFVMSWWIYCTKFRSNYYL